MSERVVAYFCNCVGAHDPNCELLLRLTIKERICKERGVLHYVPEDVRDEIDEAVARALEERQMSRGK